MVVVGECAFGQFPPPGLCVRIPAGVLETAGGEGTEVGVVEAVAPVVFVAEGGEHLGPHHRDALGLVRDPGRGAKVGHRGRGRDVAHHLDADHQRHVVPPGLEVGHRGQHGDTAGGTSGFVTRRREPSERRIRLHQETTEMALAAVDLRREVADVTHLDRVGVEAGVGQRAVHRFGDEVGERRPLASPVPDEVGLRAADDVGRLGHRDASSDSATHHEWYPMGTR